MGDCNFIAIKRFQIAFMLLCTHDEKMGKTMRMDISLCLLSLILLSALSNAASLIVHSLVIK